MSEMGWAEFGDCNMLVENKRAGIPKRFASNSIPLVHATSVSLGLRRANF